jgi:multiple sugar transport system permease protein
MQRDADVEGRAAPVRRAPRRSAPARLWPYAFIAAPLAYLAVFMVVPLVRGFSLSTTDAPLVNPSAGTSVGLDNYTALLQSPGFRGSLWATLVYTLLTVVFSVGLGTLAAVLINRRFPGRALARSVLTFPWAVPTVAAALIFSWIYNQQRGVLNSTSDALGTGQHGWLTEPRFGMFSVLLATVWKVFPLVMLVVLASLQSVPEELYEATRIDGADSLSTFRAVVLPRPCAWSPCS